jgi:hypothetical protein
VQNLGHALVVEHGLALLPQTRARRLGLGVLCETKPSLFVCCVMSWSGAMGREARPSGLTKLI